MCEGKKSSSLLDLSRHTIKMVTLLMALVLGGCAQIGPTVLATGRPLYNLAVQQTESEQLLLNIVRQRYGDPILFLDVTSISSGYSWEATAGLLGNLGSGGDNSYGTALGGRVSESPFITYAPNNGQKFVQQMLTPIDLGTVALIVQAGWSVERVMLIVGESINHLRNNDASSDPQSGYPGYQHAVNALRTLQKNGQLGLGTKAKSDDTDPELSLLVIPEAIGTEPYQTFCTSIQVHCDGQPLLLRHAIGISGDSNSMAMSTRSLSSAMYFLGQGIEVPENDVAAGVVTPTPATGPLGLGGEGKKLFAVQSSDTEPERAAVKIYYRGHWFYIADNDLDSKTTFALLSLLVMLQSGDTAKAVPLITLPVG